MYKPKLTEEVCNAYEDYLQQFKRIVFRKTDYAITEFCRSRSLNYYSFYWWLRNHKHTTVSEVRDYVISCRNRVLSHGGQIRPLTEEELHPKPKEQKAPQDRHIITKEEFERNKEAYWAEKNEEERKRRVALVEAAKQEIIDRQKPLTKDPSRIPPSPKKSSVSVEVTPKRETREAKELNPPMYYLKEGRFHKFQRAVKDNGIEVPKGYSWYMLPTEAQELFNMLDGVHWNTDTQPTDKASIAPIVSAEVDSAKFDSITIEFPEGVRTTMKWVTVSYVSKLLAAYAIRKEAYQRDPKKVGNA